MSAKHKISQNDLRKFMSLHKQNKLLGSTKKIESPLAKYLADGTLKCIVCDTVVRSEGVWTVHINAKLHKDNIAKKKQSIIPSQNRLPPDRIEDNKFVEHSTSTLSAKRPVEEEVTRPPKKLKSILKNGSSDKSSLPVGFFDSPEINIKPSLSIKSADIPLTSVKSEKKTEDSKDEEMEVIEPVPSTSTETDLPEGFFDNPILDAKARNVEYKDPVEEEWERFQKEMKEEVTLSTQIIQDESEVATVERQIVEVDEQLKNWSRVLDLEKKKETLQTTLSWAQDVKKEEDSSSSGEEDLEEFVSWRTKQSFR